MVVESATTALEMTTLLDPADPQVRVAAEAARRTLRANRREALPRAARRRTGTGRGRSIASGRRESASRSRGDDALADRQPGAGTASG
jgi:hypothetical protein